MRNSSEISDRIVEDDRPMTISMFVNNNLNNNLNNNSWLYELVCVRESSYRSASS